MTESAYVAATRAADATSRVSGPWDLPSSLVSLGTIGVLRYEMADLVFESGELAEAPISHAAHGFGSQRHER